MGNFGTARCPLYTPNCKLPPRRRQQKHRVLPSPLLCHMLCPQSALVLPVVPRPDRHTQLAIAILSTSRLLPSSPLWNLPKRACSVLTSSCGPLSVRPRLQIPQSLGRTRGSLQRGCRGNGPLPVRVQRRAPSGTGAHNPTWLSYTDNPAATISPADEAQSRWPAPLQLDVAISSQRYPLPSTSAIRSHRRDTRLPWLECLPCETAAGPPSQRRSRVALPDYPSRGGLSLVQSLKLCSDPFLNSPLHTVRSPISQSVVKIFSLSYTQVVQVVV
ncbi:hypothetical protein T440DRAFT_106064 [Plenodomus tracheiphilus IPT5]|uniref:Uncharacterized protein n=1 Tax=Plenodomus tracheiphilus IPT5 TaxID=1408161 RepID=A0A6A7BLQ0_9PLEO|nr:hypothetical protein T440DRAFT_106064 [Plenodomus tracheiphilus IPT5]